MIMQRSCPETQRLRELIDGNLPADQQLALTRHLDTCVRCQRTLESLAGGSESWCDLARGKKGDSPLPASLSPDLCRVVRELQQETVHAEDKTMPADADDLLDFLSPSEQPGHLGRLGSYEILEVIGRGGMGVVLKAFDPALHRFVAIKVLAPQLATTAAARRRFAREAQAAAAISHDHVVPIHAVEEARGLPYLVMHLVSGVSLQERLDRGGPLALKEILRIGMQTAAGLAAAHAQGLIHRDIKPANILLENGVERVKITDFGLARAIDDGSLTQSGMVAGTPQYMAPEQALGEALDPRADLFSLGSVLYAMCTGRPPFRASTNLAVLRRVSEDTPRPIRQINPEIPEWLANLIATLHAKDPANRYQSAAEVSQLLSQCLAHLQQPASNPLPAIKAPPRKTVEPRLLADDEEPVKKSRWKLVAAVLLLFLLGLGVTATAGDGPLGKFLSTILRLNLSSGTLVVEVDDPQVKVQVDGEEVVIKGAGPEEIRLRPGEHQVRATRDNQVLRDTLVTISRGDKTIVRISRDEQAAAAPANVAQPPQHMATRAPTSVVPYAGPNMPKPQPSGFPVSGQVMPNSQPAGMLTLQGQRRALWSVAFSPNGKRLAAGSGGTEDKWGELRVFDVATGQVRVILNEPLSIRSVAFSPDGKLLATGEFDRTTKLHDVATGLVRMVLHGHSAAVNVVAFSPDGQQLVTGSLDQTVRIWDTATGKEIRTLKGHTDEVYSVAVSPDGSTILSSGNDHTAKLWDAKTGAERFTLRGHTNVVEAVAFSPDGKLLATASWDRTIKLWDASTGREIVTLSGHTTPVLCLAFSPDGRWLASGGGPWGGYNFAPGPGEVKLWKLDTAQNLNMVRSHPNRDSQYTQRDHADRVFSVAFSPDGKTLASASWDGTVKLRDPATLQVRATLSVNSPWNEGPKSSQATNKPRFFGNAFTPGQPARTVLQDHSDWVWNALFLPDGRHVLSAGQDHTVRLWDAESGKETRRLEGHSEAVIGLAVSSDGGRALSSSFDGTIRLWDLKSGQELRRFVGHEGPVISVAFSPDGKQVLSGSWDHIVRLWDVETGQELRRFEGHTDRVEGVAFSPDGKRALSSSYDRSMRLWDVEAGQELRRFGGGNIGKIVRLAFSPDGRQAVTGSEDETVRLWDLEGGKEVRRFDGHTEMVTCVAFSPDGRHLLSGGVDQTVRLWEVATGKELQRFTDHAAAIWSVAFSPDGRQAISASHDHTVRIWDLARFRAQP